jgi:hypothetical protein
MTYFIRFHEYGYVIGFKGWLSHFHDLFIGNFNAVIEILTCSVETWKQCLNIPPCGTVRRWIGIERKKYHPNEDVALKDRGRHRSKQLCSLSRRRRVQWKLETTNDFAVIGISFLHHSII